MKTFLIVPGCANPKQTYLEYPLGAGMLATTLRQQGCEVAIYDQNVEGPDDDLLLDRVRRFSPDMVGLSVITPAYPAAQRQIRRLRHECPQVVIIAGGIHAGLFPEDLLADGADAVILGDGCDALRALVERWGRERPCQGLPGTVCLSADGRPVRIASSKRSSAAAEPGIVDRDVYNLPRYTHHSMLASLGCPYQCAFCGNYSGTVLTRDTILLSYDRLCREMHYLADRYCANQLFFVDDVFLLKPANVLGFCRRLEQERLAMQWCAQTRADTVDVDVAESMSAAGCRRICIGVESGSDAILRRIRKGTDRETICRGVRSAKDAGLRVKTGWIFGLPGTLQEQYESLAFMRELRPHEISIHQFIPFPGTEYYRRPADYGLRFRDAKDFGSFCYGGLGDNVTMDYLSYGELIELFEDVAAALETEGYVSSDRATAKDEYIYTTPLSSHSINPFRSVVEESHTPVFHC